MTSTNRKRRGRLDRKKESRLVLAERDREIIRAVYRFRFLTSNQLTEKFFSSKSKADRRLRELFDHGYLDRIDRPSLKGKSELIYALWKGGAELLCAEMGIAKSDLKWKSSRNSVKPERLQHELDIVSFHIAMDRSVEATPGVSWLFWNDRQEILAQKTWELLNVGSTRGGKLKLIPDAFFGLQTPKGKTIFFLEVDRGTESPRVFREKLEIYQLAFIRGSVHKTTGMKAFRVLTLTLDKHRIQILMKTTEDKQLPLLFWFTTFTQLDSNNGVTDLIWSMGSTYENQISLC